MKISPARIAAFEILRRIESERSFSSVLLPAYESELDPKDRGLCHELTLGVLRRRILLDRIIDELANHKKIDRDVRIILEIACYQLLFLDKVPAHAALNDAVNLTQKVKKTSAKGFVNAVLRRLTRERPGLHYRDDLERLSVESSHPQWLIERWSAQFGFAETEKLAAANNMTPPVSFRFTARTTEAVRESLKKPDLASDGNYLRELAANGKIYFQDPGSRMVGAAVELREGERFLDVCAAPGSKLTQVAAAAAGAASMLVGGDIHFQRVRTLRESARNQGADRVEVVQYDAEAGLPFENGAFDVVLLDAPCSGTGTIRHNPEIRYFLEETDSRVLSHKQLRMLLAASKMVKQGGKLIYSTCSLEREENEEVCGRFLECTEGFSKIAPAIPKEFLTNEGFGRTFPERDGMDGFFIAAFEKK